MKKICIFLVTESATLLVARPANQGGSFILYDIEYTKKPITIAKQIEILKQRGLSRMYSNFSNNAVKKQVSRSFTIPKHDFMRNWQESPTIVRNICAHHARF